MCEKIVFFCKLQLCKYNKSERLVLDFDELSALCVESVSSTNPDLYRLYSQNHVMRDFMRPFIVIISMYKRRKLSNF